MNMVQQIKKSLKVKKKKKKEIAHQILSKKNGKPTHTYFQMLLNKGTHTEMI